ncbi:MAG: hypothetical protein F6K40_03565 [Okeania sp. SIO3I5]|uniref:hypothetical protein n=1 Tax=Okeania sp. SIO3I5 TaxID=2607805 RepID=UPI0013B89309|nr:hypothetical protein [Okeania sp. SIO3I5]NEQ35431.1 hypothetical protein [Okeania sp. SIO3I5]
MNFVQLNQSFSKFIIFAFAPFFILLIDSVSQIVNSIPLVVVSPYTSHTPHINPGGTDKNSILLAKLSRADWRICSQQNPPLVENFYIETANFFVNICQKPNGKLIYIGGPKTNPEDTIKIAAIAEEGTGYVAEDGDITYIVTGATFSIVKNAKTINEEEVIYVCSQFSKKICQER